MRWRGGGVGEWHNDEGVILMRQELNDERRAVEIEKPVLRNRERYSVADKACLEMHV